jgi:hypothetical protein
MSPEVQMRYMMMISVALLLSGASMGCIRFFPEVGVRAPDPEENNFISVVSVLGRELTLADGRTFELSGVDVSDLRPDELEACESVIRRRTVDQPRLVLVDVREGMGRIEASVYPWTMSEKMGFGIPVFPRRIEVAPTRLDLGAAIIESGYARAKLEELHDPEMRRGYAAAEEDARAAGVGIWARGRQ